MTAGVEMIQRKSSKGRVDRGNSGEGEMRMNHGTNGWECSWLMVSRSPISSPISVKNALAW